MEPRRPEDGVTSLVGLPSRDMIYAAGFVLAAVMGWNASVAAMALRQPAFCQAGSLQAPSGCGLCRRAASAACWAYDGRGVCGRFAR